MKESEAKAKTCPHLFAAMSVASVIAVNHGAEREAIVELMGKSACHGSECVMWETWREQDNTGAWHDSDSGDCGLKTKELQCGL